MVDHEARAGEELTVTPVSAEQRAEEDRLRRLRDEEIRRRRRRAEAAVDGAANRGEVELLLVALCGHRFPDGTECLEDVARSHEDTGDSLVLSPWRHMLRRLDNDHEVRTLRVPTSRRGPW